MNPVVKRILLGFAGFCSSLAASLTTMAGGTEMTLSQLGQVPLVAWLLSIGAGIAGAIGIKGNQK